MQNYWGITQFQYFFTSATLSIPQSINGLLLGSFSNRSLNNNSPINLFFYMFPILIILSIIVGFFGKVYDSLIFMEVSLPHL